MCTTNFMCVCKALLIYLKQKGKEKKKARILNTTYRIKAFVSCREEEKCGEPIRLPKKKKPYMIKYFLPGFDFHHNTTRNIYESLKRGSFAEE